MAKGDPKAHQLYKQIGAVTFTGGAPFSPGEPSTDTIVGDEGWEVLTDPTGTHRMIANRTYIDLAGWSRQDLTTFTQGVDIQKQQQPTPIVAGTISNIWEFDILSSRRITTAELTSFGNTATIPGFLSSAVDLMQIVYGERMIYGENGTIPLAYVQLSGDTFGSGNPTAMDKLHWTRFIIMPSVATGGIMTVYPTNLVVQAMTLEEKDLVWMERLRRSYVLQGEL
jgi:hypothetical protein